MFHNVSLVHTHNIYTMQLHRIHLSSRILQNLRPPRDGVTAEAPTMEQIQGFQKVAPEGSATKETTCSICLEDIEIGGGTEPACRFGMLQILEIRKWYNTAVMWAKMHENVVNQGRKELNRC